MNPADDLLRSVPHRVGWPDVVDVHRFDERFGAVNAVLGAIMDVTTDYVELSVDHETPTHDELVAWSWLIRPDLGKTLREIATNDMREAIDYYEESQ